MAKQKTSCCSEIYLIFQTCHYMSIQFIKNNSCDQTFSLWRGCANTSS
uniref:Uncharacterized protein n=1 Tax=Anguilla anguilla TaxID=7936 RepID=A0A0E9VDV5_ANGAN